MAVPVAPAVEAVNYQGAGLRSRAHFDL